MKETINTLSNLTNLNFNRNNNIFILFEFKNNNLIEIENLFKSGITNILNNNINNNLFNNLIQKNIKFLNKKDNFLIKNIINNNFNPIISIENSLKDIFNSSSSYGSFISNQNLFII